MAKSQSDSSRVRQDQPESTIREYDYALLRGLHKPMSDLTNDVRSPFLYAHLEVVRFTAWAPPSARRRRRQAMRKFGHGAWSGYKHSRVNFPEKGKLPNELGR